MSSRAERKYSFDKRPVKIWSPIQRDVFRDHEQWNGLPDMVVTITEQGVERIYVIEFENSPTNQKIALKKRQFQRYGVKDVIVIPINRFQDKTDWVKIDSQLEEWLP